MTVNSSAYSVILILFAFSDNLSAENSKSSPDYYNCGNHLFGCMLVTNCILHMVNNGQQWTTIRGATCICDAVFF